MIHIELHKHDTNIQVLAKTQEVLLIIFVNY